MEDLAPDPNGEEAEEHEEGEISDEEPAEVSPVSEEPEDSSGAENDASEEPAVALSANISRSAYDRELRPLNRRPGLDDPIESVSGENRKGDISRARGRELDSLTHEDDGGNSLNRNAGWGSYGANLYNFAWATAVSGRPTFPTAADLPATEGQGAKHAGDGLLPSRSGILSSWAAENHRKLSRTFSRDSQYYTRSTGRSSEERNDLSPVRENGGRVGERGSAEREAAARRRRTRETSWSDWDTSSRTDKPPTLRSKIEKASVYTSTTEDQDYYRRDRDGEDLSWRKKRTDFPESNGKSEERESRGRSSAAEPQQNGDRDGEAEAKEEGELEEGEIELATLPAAQSASPSREPSELNRQSRYGGVKPVEHSVEPKDWAFGRSVSSKSLSSPQAEEYASRRHRAAKALEIQKERRLSLALASDLSLAGDLVKNVTVKDAQKSFVDVCERLYKALRVLDDLNSATRKRASQEGWMDTFVNQIAALAKQAFAGIRAVHAVRNTASGREQERDKNIFPRLLELANGPCQKLFTPKQIRELETMIQTIANVRAVRDATEKGQYQRDQHVVPAPKKTNDSDAKQGNRNAESTAQAPSGMGTKNVSDGGLAGRSFGFVDSKQAEEAAGIAAAALAYARSSAAARASSVLGSSNDNRAGGAPLHGTGMWGWLPEMQSQSQFSNPILNSLHTNYNGYNFSMAKHQAWSDTDQRALKLAQDGYGGHLGETMLPDRPIPTFPQHLGPKVSNAPPGYSKSSGAVSEDDSEKLKPPGAGLPTYVSSDPLLPPGVKDESVRSQVWPPIPESDSVPPSKKTKSTAPQFNAESLLTINHQRNGGTPYMYASERLPSPTPDEDEDAPATAPGRSMEAKHRPVSRETTRLDAVSQPERAQSGLLNSTPPPGAVHSLKRTQSLDDRRLGVDPKVQSSVSEEPAVPFPTQSADETEMAKVSTSQPMLGPLRSRDPRRRIHNHSLDLSYSGSMNLRSQTVPARTGTPSLEGALTTGLETRKRLSSDVTNSQDFGIQKRQKGQLEGELEVTGFSVDSFQASTGTGGWLDDNIVPFSGIEDTVTDMEVVEEGRFTGLEGKSGMEVDTNTNGKLDVIPEQLNGAAASLKTPKVDSSQSIGESGPRKMKPRDPRRVFIVKRVGDASSDDNVRVDGVGANRAEASLVVSGPVEVTARNREDGIQASKQGASVTQITSQYMESTSVTTGMVSSSSLQVAKRQQVVHSGGGHVNTEGRTGADSVGVSGVSVTRETTLHVLPDQLKDKLTTAGMGLRKKKGSPSQWGASHIHPGLEQLLEDLSSEERLRVQLERKRRMEEQDRMFSAGKLCLVLDLDHTLLNSAKFSEIEQEWDQRLRAAESAERNRAGRDGLERRELFRFPHMSMWTKLRPGIWKFLARASQLYELHVYTMGNKVYATEMAKLLDPTGKLFAGRVISKGDDGDGDDILPKSKDLDGVLGMESAVVIIDDSARVWPHHSENLIVVERYMYFPCSRRQFALPGPSLLEVGHDERESDGMLASALGVIDRIHQNFFKNPRLREVDVREILASQQRQVLAGCKVVFSRVFPVGEADPHRHPLWRTAENFGAICTINIDEEVTHIVAISLGTDKVNWGLETGRYVVRPAWLEASTILYRRANERDFPVLPQ